MVKHLVRASLLISVAIVRTGGDAPAQTTIAHWSFDTPTITTGTGGILTAADATSMHHATTQFGGTGGAGGPQINSIAGQFGQAANFTNAQANGAAQTNYAWMSFPQLTEIAGPTAGDFSVAVWVNVPPESPSWDSNTILADWGNAPAGTHRFTYWFSLANVDSNLELRPRGQIRAGNAPPDPATIDIIATTISAAQASSGTPPGPTTFDDNTWHHLAWTWTKSTGQMRYYTDGVLRHTQTSTQTGDNLNVLVSDSPIGALGAKRDNNRYFRGALDEVWVFTGALSDAQVNDLFQTNTPPGGVVVPTNLTLQIDPVSGATQIKNTTDSPITFNSYRVTSPSGALNVVGWNPISNGNEHQDQFPLGNGTGNGWEVAPNPSNSELVEWYLTDNSTLNPNETLYLGNAFNPAGAHDVVFRYTSPELSLRSGIIEYVTVTPPAGVPGDYNNNGVVDAADYVAWRENLNQSVTLPNDATPGTVSAADYDVWRANFGRTVGSGSAFAAGDAVPEPAALALLLLGCLAAVLPRREGPAMGGM
jgi:hypothetical protein